MESSSNGTAEINLSYARHREMFSVFHPFFCGRIRVQGRQIKPSGRMRRMGQENPGTLPACHWTCMDKLHRGGEDTNKTSSLVADFAEIRKP